MEPWEAPLHRGDIETAWGLFIDRYRRLILATIRGTLDRGDDVPDVFAEVCQTLASDGLAPLGQYVKRAGARARFSTWLVVVVRNQTINWIRRQSGRRRITPPESLSVLQREIFRHVFADRRSHIETYEILTAGSAPDLPFGAFLRELAETYRHVERRRGRGVLRYLAPPPMLEPQPAPQPEDTTLAADARERLGDALQSLPKDQQVAIQLFVVDGIAAADVARTVGWRNAKEVYNRVYRALDRLRKALERQGIRSGDL